MPKETPSPDLKKIAFVASSLAGLPEKAGPFNQLVNAAKKRIGELAHTVMRQDKNLSSQRKEYIESVYTILTDPEVAQYILGGEDHEFIFMYWASFPYGNSQVFYLRKSGAAYELAERHGANIGEETWTPVHFLRAELLPEVVDGLYSVLEKLPQRDANYKTKLAQEEEAKTQESGRLSGLITALTDANTILRDTISKNIAPKAQPTAKK